MENKENIDESAFIMKSSTKQLTLTVNDMLSLAQLDSDKFRIKTNVFDIRKSINEVMDI